LEQVVGVVAGSAICAESDIDAGVEEIWYPRDTRS